MTENSTPTGADASQDAPPSRDASVVVHEFTASGPIRAVVKNARGALALRAEHGNDVRVELTARDEIARELIDRTEVDFTRGVLRINTPRDEFANVSGRVGDIFREGDSDAPWSDRIADSLRSVLRGAQGLGSEIDIAVVVPAGSTASLTTGAGEVSSRGVLDELGVTTGAGSVALDRSALRATRLRSGAGDIRVDDVTGALSANSGTGDISVSRSTGSLTLSTGSGGIRVHAAREGIVHARTGMGDIEVHVVEGTATRLDLASGWGDRDVRLAPTDGAAADRTLEVTAKTGKGDLRVLRASEA